jgi:hypothetical protein
LSENVHKKIIEKSLNKLDPDRATYFGVIANLLEKDVRIEDNANMVFSVLKDVMTELPVYLDEKQLIEQLLEFIEQNHHDLQVALFDPKFVRDPSSIRSVTGAFIHQIIKIVLLKHQNGDFEEASLRVHKYTWPYRDIDIIDPDDEPDEWAAAAAKNEKWRLQNDGIDRRKRDPARIDDISPIKPEKDKIKR